MNGFRYCCTIIWGWMNAFGVHNRAINLAESDYEFVRSRGNQIRAEEICYVNTATRCYHDSEPIRATCWWAEVEWDGL